MTRPANTPPAPPAGWSPAPPGSLLDMRDHLRWVRRRRLFLKAAAGGLAAVGALALGWSFVGGGENDRGGIRCSTVRHFFAACRAGCHPEQIDVETSARIKAHLEGCAKCRASFGTATTAPPCDTTGNK